MTKYDDFHDGVHPFSLREGEGVFYTSDAAFRDMLCALCGISGNPAEEIRPRLLIADANDNDCVASCVQAALDWNVPILLCGEFPGEMATEIAPPESVVCQWLTRPFLYQHFLAAMYSLLTMEENASSLHPLLAQPPFIRFDPVRGKAVYGTRRQHLSPGEATLFQKLLSASPEPVSRTELATGFLRQDGNTVDVYIGYLRRKLAEYPLVIQSVRKQGYALILSLGDSGQL